MGNTPCRGQGLKPSANIERRVKRSDEMRRRCAVMGVSRPLWSLYVLHSGKEREVANVYLIELG